MKKLLSTIVMFAALAAIATAQPKASVSVGYREKGIDFGTVVDENSAATASADLLWKSFHFGAGIETHLDSTRTSKDGLYRADLLAGYKFFSTLADVEVGAHYLMKNHPGKYDFTGHTRPFVTLSKGWVSVTGQMDLESQLSNVEANIAHTFPVVGAIALKPSAFIGYTDCNDSLPKTKKELKYTNAYYGGGLDIVWKKVSFGGVLLHRGATGKTTTGIRGSVGYSF